MSERHEWLAEPLPADVAAALERLQRAPSVEHVAVMPDVHLSRDVCVGTVVATSRLLYPAAVGGDAGCGMLAASFDVEAARLEEPRIAARVLAGLQARVPILKHARDGPLPETLAERSLSDGALMRERERTAGVQLGTLGRGNHFLELQSDEEGRLWLMVHSGSRGIGVTIREHHEARAERVRGGLRALDAETEAGRDYLLDLAWALDYASLNRERLMLAATEVVWDVLGASRASEPMSCHHNFVRRERHGGRDLWVHRKGAISAGDGEAGIVPGSMGTRSFHVLGRGHPGSLASCSHGAGRALPRGEARKRIRRRDLEEQMRGVWYDRRMGSRLLDEAPGAYKDIGAVLRAQKALTRVTRRLEPVLVHKGG